MVKSTPLFTISPRLTQGAVIAPGELPPVIKSVTAN